jgi:pyridoxine 5'-phosphate synthase PdxJ
MTRLSVNINKIATLRNARGANNPDVIRAAMDCERFGAQGGNLVDIDTQPGHLLISEIA